MKTNRRLFSRWLWAILIPVAMLIVFFVSVYVRLEALVDRLPYSIDLSLVPDGYYIGEAESFPITVQVSVLVQDSKIVAIYILDHNSGQGTPAEQITTKVIEAQSLEVDTIATATYSSVLILQAIHSALSEAIENYRP